MEGKSKEFSDKKVRVIVKKDTDERLRSELIGCQSILSCEEVNDLPRSSLVGYVTLLRQLNKSTLSCRNKILELNPQDSKIIPDDSKELLKSKSVSDDREGATSVSSLVQSQVVTQTIWPTTDSSIVIKSIDYLIALQKEEREERDKMFLLKEKKDKEEKLEKEKKDKEEKLEKEKKDKEEKLEKELKRKEEMEEKAKANEMKEKKEKEEKLEKEKKDKEEKLKKEMKRKEEKEEKAKENEKKEKKKKEEKLEKEKKDKEEKLKKEKKDKEEKLEKEKKDKEEKLEKE